MAWKKGESGNPGGRPRVLQGVRRKAQNASDEAIETLLKEMRGAEKSSERISAAVKVLQLAGAAMSEEKPTEGDTPPPGVPREYTPEQLEAAATKGEA